MYLSADRMALHYTGWNADGLIDIRHDLCCTADDANIADDAVLIAVRGNNIQVYLVTLLPTDNAIF